MYKLTPQLRKILAKPAGELFPGDPDESIPKAIEWMKGKGWDPEHPPNLSDSKEFRIICVGDVVTKSFLEHPVLKKFVKLCFVDGNTQRGASVKLDAPIIPENAEEGPENGEFGFFKKHFNNPREHIVGEIFDRIREWLSDDRRYIIMVEGEEDLLVLPAALESVDDFIFYGQPPITSADMEIPAGLVGIFSESGKKEEFRKILDLFEKA